MKRLALALLATAGLATTGARAGHDSRVVVHADISIGAPAYRAPSHYVHAPRHYAPSRGYWKEVVVKTWVPERWVVRHDRWGRPFRHCEPGYFVYHTNRVWVDDDCAPVARGRGNAYGHYRR